MYFIACDLESSKNFPRKASSAELLLEKERSLDFIWQDSNGAQVLSHWNAFTYGQADMLAHVGIGRIYIAHLALSMRSDRHIARRVKAYVKQLSPYTRTPYMCAPIGFDFVEPIRDLVFLLDRYNQKYYPHTGIWTVNAGMDDYLSLVEGHREKLPVVDLDPNPYWTGFYTARPTLKKSCRNLVDKLLLAENIGVANSVSNDLAEPWWTAVVSNHHDFITGTSPDAVVEQEQIPWLDEALEKIDSVLDRLPHMSSDSSEEKSGGGKPDSGRLSWKREKGIIRITTPFYLVEIDESKGGGILSLKSRSDDGDKTLLTGISNDLVSYRDAGGLWRMGMEFAGGKWKESAKASSRSVALNPVEHDETIEVVSIVELNGESFTRRMWFSSESPVLRCRVEGRAALGYSVVLRLKTEIHTGRLSMDTSGGTVERPLDRNYNPTFWPLYRFVHFTDEQNGRGIAVLQDLPGAVSCRENGQIELVAMRNAPKETVLGFIGIPANPASGHERESYGFEYSLVFTKKGNWKENGIHRMVQHSFIPAVVTTDSADVTVIAVKNASRGEGIIVRLYASFPPGAEIVVEAPLLEINKAFLCDARERDLEPLEVQNGKIRLEMKGNISTLRLLK